MSNRPQRLRRFVAVDLGRARLTAVGLTVGKRGVTVGAHLTQPIPDDVDPLDTEWIGKWMGRMLTNAGLGKGPLVFALARRTVSLKRMTLPTTVDSELPGMVAFRLRSELPFPPEDAAIDFSIVKQAEGQTELIAAALRREAMERLREIAHHAGRKVARITLRPLATAALLAEVERDLAGSVLAVDLRDFGELEVVVDWNGSLRFARGAEPHFLETPSGRSQRARELDLAEATAFRAPADARVARKAETGPSAGVVARRTGTGQRPGNHDDPEETATDFIFRDDDDLEHDGAANVRSGAGAHSDAPGSAQSANSGTPGASAGSSNGTAGSASPTAGADADAEADLALDHESAARIATEVRRSWMSYRVTDDAPDVQRIVVIGIDGLAGAVARRLRKELGRPAEVLLSRSGVSGETEDLGPAWPLVGVGLEYVEGRDPLDFAHPKKAPDLAAARIRVALVGLAALVCVGLFGWSLAQRQLDELQGEYDALVKEFSDLEPRVWDLRRRQVRLEHLERWEATSVDWLDHMAYIADRLPPADEAVLTGFAGSMEALGVDEGKFKTEDGVRRWSWSPAGQIVTLQFDGATTDRPVSDRLRSRFVDDATYIARSVGSDAPNKDPKYTASFGLRLQSAIRSPLAALRAAERSTGMTPSGPDADATAAARPGSDVPPNADRGVGPTGPGEVTADSAATAAADAAAAGTAAHEVALDAKGG